MTEGHDTLKSLEEVAIALMLTPDFDNDLLFEQLINRKCQFRYLTTCEKPRSLTLGANPIKEGRENNRKNQHMSQLIAVRQKANLMPVNLSLGKQVQKNSCRGIAPHFPDEPNI